MQFALDPITFRQLSPAIHALRKKQHGKNAICAACNAEVFDHSVGSLVVLPHFNHVADSGPCRLKGLSTETDAPDYTGDGEKLRKEFFHPEPVKFAFAVCQSLVCGILQGDRYVRGNFTFTRFKELLHLADSKRTWCLKGLTPKLLPFAFVSHEVFYIRACSQSC